MQIILVQTEVEQALRNFVASRLTLAEGTTFSIDLAATRGVNGITATIDLVEPGQKPAPQLVTPVTKPAVKQEAPKATEAQQATQAPAPVEATPEVAETPADEPAVQTEPEAEPAAPTKSLFGNLARPKN